MKIRVKKKLLKESNQKGVDLGYSDIENVRIMIGKNIDRAVLTPSDGIDHFEEEEEATPRDDAKQMNKKDYVNRIRDVVKDGRQVPYLYYAYKGIDDQGNILNDNNLAPVYELQLKKAGMLVTRLEHSGDASVDMFLCDFGLIMQLHEEWDKRYEERMKDLLPKRTYDRLALKKGYDRAEFQAGRKTNIRPFSTVSVGRGSKPIFHQNVDFMYKTSQEPNRKIDPNHLWAFSIRVPLSIAYMILSGMGMPSRPKSTDNVSLKTYRQARRQAAIERRNITPKKINDAYNHWATNKNKYIAKYMEVMKQEPNSWINYFDPQKTIDFFNLDFNKFNNNYVESRRSGDFEKERKALRTQFGPHWSETVPSDFGINVTLMQPPPMSKVAMESVLDKLDDSEMSKKIAKSLINSMTVNKNNEIKKNIATNLQQLVQQNSNDKAVQNNIAWIQHAIQMYYVMGGK